MKKHGSTILLLMILLAGVALLLYPAFSSYYNGIHQSRAVQSYEEQVAKLPEEMYESYFREADAYNVRLLEKRTHFISGKPKSEEYQRLLSVNGDTMAVIEIPKLDLRLPVYHGTSEEVLGSGVGHLEGSSLPAGGKGTHTVLTGHRGLPSSTLFTGLDKLEKGDLFIVTVLNRKLCYEVEEISIVEPEEMDGLKIDPEKDLCTLVTCTPYGVNTHRMFVRGIRTEKPWEAASAKIESNAEAFPPWLTAVVAAVPVFILGALGSLLFRRGNKKKGGKDDAEENREEEPCRRSDAVPAAPDSGQRKGGESEFSENRRTDRHDAGQ